MLRTLEQMNGSVALGFSSEDQLLGALVIRDERLREAYSTDEIELFRGVATGIGVTLQNSQVYERMKERDRLAALGQMAAGLAHEIRNPLGAIKGAAQFLQPGQLGEGGRDSREGTRRAPASSSTSSSRRSTASTRSSRSSSTTRAPTAASRRPLDVNDVRAQDALLLVDKEAEEQAKVEIVTDLAEGLPPVRADAEQLLQVFLNLSLNAVQAMPDGGQLVHLDQPAPRRPGGARRRPSWRSASATPASASRPATCKNLFIPFFTTKDKGTGLGLPISQRIIENHGGTIEVRSQPGEGATFTVLLPDRGRRLRRLPGVDPGRAARAATTRRGPPPLPPPLPPGGPGRLPPHAEMGPPRRAPPAPCAETHRAERVGSHASAPRRTPPLGVERGKLPPP